MRGEPFTENQRLLLLTAPTGAVLTRQGQDHRLVLARAVAEALEIVVEPVDALHALARGLDRLERQDVAEEARVDVLLLARRRVKIEVAFEVPGTLQDLRDVRGPRLHTAHDLRDVARAGLVQLKNLFLLAAVLDRFLCRRPRLAPDRDA